jgi:hypothetical protein
MSSRRTDTFAPDVKKKLADAPDSNIFGQDLEEKIVSGVGFGYVILQWIWNKKGGAGRYHILPGVPIRYLVLVRNVLK